MRPHTERLVRAIFGPSSLTDPEWLRLHQLMNAMETMASAGRTLGWQIRDEEYPGLWDRVMTLANDLDRESRHLLERIEEIEQKDRETHA